MATTFEDYQQTKIKNRQQCIEVFGEDVSEQDHVMGLIGNILAIWDRIDKDQAEKLCDFFLIDTSKEHLILARQYLLNKAKLPSLASSEAYCWIIDRLKNI